MTELFSAQAEGDTLEHAAERTQEFLLLVGREMEALGFNAENEKIWHLCTAAAPALTTPEEHYALREIIAQSFTSVAYRYLANKWTTP